MAKCKVCGKFLSSVDVAKCDKCLYQYHRMCVGLSAKSKVTSTWHCPTCQVLHTTADQSKTPIQSKSHVKDKNVGIDGIVGQQQLFSTPVASESSEDLIFNIRTELKLAVEEMMANMRREFQQLREDMGARIDNLEKKVTAIEEKQHRHSAPSSDVEKIIGQLKRDLNDREQELLLNDVNITNLPEAIGENVLHTALLVATKLGLNIDERDIVSAERVGARRINATESVSTPGLLPVRPRSLVVRLARRDLRDKWLVSARTRRGATSADLELPGPTVRFYVNEQLTKHNRQLFRQARDMGDRFGWKYVWSKRGRIFARQKPGESACIIRSEADLQQVFGDSAE